MVRLPGILKVATVFLVDYLALQTLFNGPVALIILGVLALYVWLGGYLALFKEGGVRLENLPTYVRIRLSVASSQLARDVKTATAADISRMKIFLINSDDIQATAYGCKCVSVTRGTLDNTDPVTLNAVLAHEVSHALNLDPEFSRAVFSSMILICGAMSVISAAFVVLVFLVFLVFSLFRSFLGFIAFRGTTKVVRGVFDLFQKGIVLLYRSISSLYSRATEYRCDRFSASLGYGLQLAHFLSMTEPETCRQLSLSDALYRSHPSTSSRVARLEAYVSGDVG